MALIRPSADLRNNYNEIAKLCHETKEPVYITKNGATDLVILSDEAYEELIKKSTETEEERIDRLIRERFSQHYNELEKFKEGIISQIERVKKEVK